MATMTGQNLLESIIESTLSQKVLAEILHVQQPAIAKLEKRADMYLSTLRSHIEAMGGELEIVARFPGGSVKIRDWRLGSE